MGFFGLFGVAVTAVLADLAGNSDTRPFTRFVFVATLLFPSGVSVGGLANQLFQAVMSVI